MQGVQLQELLHWTMGFVLPLQVAVHFLELQINSVPAQAWP